MQASRPAVHKGARQPLGEAVGGTPLRMASFYHAPTAKVKAFFLAHNARKGASVRGTGAEIRKNAPPPRSPKISIFIPFLAISLQKVNFIYFIFSKIVHSTLTFSNFRHNCLLHFSCAFFS